MIFIQLLISFSPNTHTCKALSEPLSLNTGRNIRSMMRQSSMPQISIVYFLFDSLISWLASSTISSPQISSSIVIWKYFAIAFSESILGYPLPYSDLEIAVRETKSFSASSSWVNPASVLRACNFSLNSISVGLLLANLIWRFYKRKIDPISHKDKRNDSNRDVLICPVNFTGV